MWCIFAILLFPFACVFLGHSGGTVLFVGQPDHFIPSTSQVLTQNEMFVVAGRVIGHSFIHGGPRLTGLSPSILEVLLTDCAQTATVTLENVADIDIRETIKPVSNRKSFTSNETINISYMKFWN